MFRDRFAGTNQFAMLRQKIDRQRLLVGRKRASGENCLADEAILAELLATLADLMRSRETMLRADMRRSA